MAELDYLFNPNSIALVGISITQPHHWTRSVMEGLLDFQYQGTIYPVNPNGGEIKGYRVYRDLQELPEVPDYVIGLVPASAGPQLVKDCAAKGVKAIQFVTAGFAETGEEEGVKLQDEMERIARETGVRIIGPNCLGIYCPGSRLSFSPFFPHDGGSVGFISQSGGNATSMVRRAIDRGVRFSKVVSYGNASDINESDFLEYLADDAETEIIGLYIEGTSDGGRLRKALAKAAQRKTVVLLKGGVTEGGNRAAASHTGAISGSERIWAALCRQLGVIQVSSMRELIDVLVTLLFFKPLPAGRNAVVIGAGGGSSVLITDTFERRGIKVPRLPDDIYWQLREFTPAAGNILRNPLDYTQGVEDPKYHMKMADLVSNWEAVDFVIKFIIPTNAVQPGILSPATSGVIGEFFTWRGSSFKPMAVVVGPGTVPEEKQFVDELTGQCVESGVPVFSSFEDAARAIDVVLRHYEEGNSRATDL